MAIRDRLRRTMMFLPGNNPSMITDAYIYGPDSVMIDLEDATSVNQKDAARFLVSEALKTIDYCKSLQFGGNSGNMVGTLLLLNII